MGGLSKSLHLRHSSTDQAAHRAAALAFFLGAAMVFTIGFSQPAMIHNAAHDLRHAAGFPCH